MMPVRENVYTFGPDKSLVAAVTEPVRGAGENAAPVIVILNTGIIHRVGHQRKFVTLARELAARGYIVVRFDFGGIGDSERRGDNLPALEGCLDDIRVILDWLEASRGHRRSILLGLCSGADHAIIYAGSDPRVVGAGLLDPLGEDLDGVPAHGVEGDFGIAAVLGIEIGDELLHLRAGLRTNEAVGGDEDVVAEFGAEGLVEVGSVH